MKYIDKENTDSHPEEYEILQHNQPSQVVQTEKDCEKHKGSDEFDDKVMPVYLCSAVFAFPTQKKITENRDVQPEGNMLITLRTMRRWKNDGFFSRYTIYDDIEETAESCTQDND